MEINQRRKIEAKNFNLLEIVDKYLDKTGAACEPGAILKPQVIAKISEAILNEIGAKTAVNAKH